MTAIDPNDWIAALNAWPPEAVWVVMLLAAFAMVLVFLRLFGAVGMQVFVVVAVLAANVQVLKTVSFSVFPDPIALGTVLFACTYLCTDILAEYYGRREAQKAVVIGFVGYLAFLVFVLIGLGFQPLTADQLTPEQLPDYEWSFAMQDHIAAVFVPGPAFFVAGMAAYFISQFNDIWLFRLIRRMTDGRHLWLRNNVSTAISALIDSAIFSVLAWVVLNPEPLAWPVVIVTYILGSWVLRLVVAALDTPVIYLARHCLPPADRIGGPAAHP